jgi:DNA-binding CsgD family transcriptional regulator/tetratricopeptide (TPR) repeat protein
VLGILKKLDGLPLALELAAARIQLLPPEALLERLNAPLRWLTGGAINKPEHQRTLRATLEWSVNLLEPCERKLLERLGVFVGGFSPESAEAICDVDLGCEVLDVLTSLSEKSLLKLEGHGRLGMLETIREHALGMLEASGQAQTIRQRHLEHFLDLAERLEPQLRSEGGERAAQMLDHEHDNLRAALAWSLECKHTERALRLAATLGEYWSLRAHFSEGSRWLDAALAQAESAQDQSAQHRSTHARAKAFVMRGCMALYVTDLTQARTNLETGLARWRELNEPLEIANALTQIGLVERRSGNLASAITHAEQALEIARVHNNARLSATALFSLGAFALDVQDYARACELYEECQTIRQSLGDRIGVGRALVNWGTAILHQGDLTRAALVYEQAISVVRETGDRRFTAIAINNLGDVAFEQGNLGRAEVLFTECLELYAQIGDPNGVAFAIESLATVHARHGRDIRAAWLYGAANSLREGSGSIRPAFAQAQFDRIIVPSIERLGATNWTNAVNQGQMMSTSAALTTPEPTQNLEPSNPSSSPLSGPPSSTAPRMEINTLTQREREVLQLVAHGLSDKLVAKKLEISPFTVGRHLSTIYGKLEVRSRAQATRWALEHMQDAPQF